MPLTNPSIHASCFAISMTYHTYHSQHTPYFMADRHTSNLKFNLSQHHPKTRLIGDHPVVGLLRLLKGKFFDHRPNARQGAEFQSVFGIDGAPGGPAAD